MTGSLRQRDEPARIHASNPSPRSRTELRGTVEAVVFVADQPVTADEIARAADADPHEVEQILGELATEFEQERRGFVLQQVAEGWRMYTHERFADVVERFVLDGQQTRLTQAALETLAIIASRQPVTRSRVAAIRGVGVDGVFRTLTARGLIEVCGTDPEAGAHLYRTTALFLEKLGLRDLGELPALAPLLPHPDDVLDDSP